MQHRQPRSAPRRFRFKLAFQRTDALVKDAGEAFDERRPEQAERMQTLEDEIDFPPQLRSTGTEVVDDEFAEVGDEARHALENNVTKFVRRLEMDDLFGDCGPQQRPELDPADRTDAVARLAFAQQRHFLDDVDPARRVFVIGDAGPDGGRRRGDLRGNAWPRAAPWYRRRVLPRLAVFAAPGVGGNNDDRHENKPAAGALT